MKTCINCDRELNKGVRFCSHDCQQSFQYQEYIVSWLQGNEDGGTKKGVSNRVRRFLFEMQHGQCAICKLDEWLGQPIPLIADHIDGNSDNHSYQNVRLVCGNCDMMLPTYKNKNKGNGRHYRRERYKEKVSY